MLFSKETIKNYAASKGISQIDDTVYQIISQDLEYRIKELCQEASKFMYASRRTKLTIEDVNSALTTRNIDPLFGYDSTEMLNFKQLNNFFYIPDEEIDLEDFLNKPLPKIPLKPAIKSHWLAIEGVQPQIPENIIKDSKKEVSTQSLQNYIDDTEIKVTSKHVLSKELQLYFDKINGFIRGTEEEKAMALECLENDSGIQQLIPYFIHLFYENIASRKDNFDKENVLITILMLYALIRNPYIFIDPYLHQIIPALLTGLVGNDLSSQVREYSCIVIKYIYGNFTNTYSSLGPRIINTLKMNAIDDTKDENVQYYSLYCLALIDEKFIKEIVEKNEFSAENKTEKIQEFLQKYLL